MEKQREFSEKLQELFDDLTQTENRLIGHQQQAASAKSVGDLQQYQQEHQVQPGNIFYHAEGYWWSMLSTTTCAFSYAQEIDTTDSTHLFSYTNNLEFIEQP